MLDTAKYCEIIKNPSLLETTDIFELEKVIQKYPFLQSARALHLKGLFHQNSPRYNHWLKQTAAQTTDRSVLFDFIISEDFKTLPIEKKLIESVEEAEFSVEPEIEIENNLLIPDGNQNISTSNEENNPTTEIEEKLSVGKPLVFDANEQHSFEEWLQLTKLKPIVRESEEKIDSKKIEVVDEKLVIEDDSADSLARKANIIEQFIKANPKIKPKKETTNLVQVKTAPQDTNSLMTETLARIYLEQKKYQKAIQAYEILILKYPEKSYLFADRIEDIKILQQNNN